MTSSAQPNEEETEWLESLKPTIHQEIRNFNHQDIIKLIQSSLFREFLWIYETKINKKNTLEEDKLILIQLMRRKVLMIRKQAQIKRKEKAEELEKRKLVIAAILKTLKIDYVLKNIFDFFYKTENNNINNNNNITNLDQMLLEKRNLMLLYNDKIESNASTEATTQEKKFHRKENSSFKKHNSKLFSAQLQTKLQQQIQARRKVKLKINLTTQINNAEISPEQESENISPLLIFTTQKQEETMNFATEINNSNQNDNNNNDNNNIESNISTNNEYDKQKYINIKDNNTNNENTNNNINKINDNNNIKNHNNNIKKKQSKNNFIIIIISLLITTLIQYTPLNDSNISLQAQHQLEHVVTVMHMYIILACKHKQLEHVLILYEYLISPPLLFSNYIGYKRHRKLSQNSRKKNKALQHRIEEEKYTHILISKNTENITLSWHGQQDSWSKWNQYQDYKAIPSKGQQFRHDDGKDQAQFAWLASNKIRKKSQRYNAG